MLREKSQQEKKEKSHKKKQTRRGLRRKTQSVQLVLLGCNAAGLKQKKQSLWSKIEKFQAGCVFIQETKLYRKGQITLPNLQVFEQVRTGKKGGGLLLAIHQNLDPVLIFEGDDDVELIVVQGHIGSQNIRFINAYGPQEDEQYEKVLGFYQKLEEEIVQAINSNCFVMMECDANAKLGYEVIKNDPNPQSKNGSLLMSLVQRNNLVVVNSTDLCSGLITRHKVTKTKEEKAVLDYVIVCDKLYAHVSHMVINEDRNDVLTKYASKKGIEKIVKSDHNLLVCSFDIILNHIVKKPRVEIFNFKDVEGQKKFLLETSKNKLAKSFDHSTDVNTNANKFHKTLMKLIHKCFKKVRVLPKRDFELEQKLARKDTLARKLAESPVDADAVRQQLSTIDHEIQQHCANENAEKVRKQFQMMSNLDGGFSANGMWKVKKSVIRKHVDPPMAKRDTAGNLITSPSLLKKLYLDEYVFRLRHREIKPELQTLKGLKDDLWERRFKMMKANKTADWSLDEVRKVLHSLKTNKARDPLGYANEIFQPGVCGDDLVEAVTLLVNGVKREMCTPDIMKLNNISTIYKNKGSRFDLVNDRGIFNMVAFRKILDRLIYDDKYDCIDRNMSDSNVGGRKRRNIRNHLFIVYGIINSVMNNESSPIDLQFYDLKQCFDAMWLEESMNNLADTVGESHWDDKLALIYQNNCVNHVAIKTPFGLTKRVSVENIVTQGGVWGPLQCSNQIDGIGKECESRNIHLTTYKNKVKIPPLAMIDDILAPAVCGIQSVAVNTFINSKTEMKKLGFSFTKCNKIHVGKCNPFCPELQVHGDAIGSSTHEKYLGDVIGDTIMGDGCNKKNIKSRKSKGMGIISQIMSYLNSVSLGYHYFDIACVLRESLLVNGILTNCEVWYGLTKQQVKELEDIDRLLLRRVFDSPISTPTEAFYLELG